MLLFILAAKGARNNSSDVDALAAVIGIVLAILFLLFAVGSPVMFIVSGAKVCAAESKEIAEAALNIMAEAALGVLGSYVVCITLLATGLTEYISPRVPTVIAWGTLGVITFIIALVVLAFKCWNESPVVTGVCLILLGSLALILNGTTLVLKLKGVLG